MTGNKPVKKYRAGGITMPKWANKDDKGNEYFTYGPLQRGYKVGDKWKNTDSFRLNDLPKVITVCWLAFKDTVSSSQE